jgi:uncharacterized protein YecE (DUF72 family)
VRILAGTSGWSFPAWKGPFYPPDLASRDLLPFYASRLPAVEVNATFYRMPSRAMLAGWRTQVPPGFRFALKASQRITHKARLLEVEEPLGHFLRTAAELGERLGPVLFQLPPFLRKDVGRLRAVLGLLPRGVQAAFEFRHASWLDDEVLTALADAGAALCVAEAEETSTPLVATAPFGYLRLRRPGYDAAAIAAWTDRIHAMPWVDAYVFFKHEEEARGTAYAQLMARQAGTGAHASPDREASPASPDRQAPPQSNRI